MKKASLTFKLASVLLAVAVLLSAFSVSATTVNGYYKTIASQDYEEVNTEIAKKENVTITTFGNGSTGYLYANPDGIKNFSVAPISGMQKDEQYTYMIDLYIIDYSNDANGCITRLDIANMDGGLVEAYLGKDRYSLNQWYTYSQNFTYNTTKDSWYSIYTFGEARVIYDNLRIVDANGNVIYSEDFETEKIDLPEGFSYIHDYSGSSVDANDKVLHLTNNTTNNVSGTIGEFALGEENTRATYTLTYDYLIKRKSTNESIDFVFRYSSYCSECLGNIAEHKPQGDRDHYIGTGKETNKWYSDTLTFNFDDKCDNTYAEIHLFPNADVIFDNIVVKDSKGNVVKTFDMDAASITGGIGRGTFGGDVEFSVKNELLWLKGAPNVVDGHLYVDASELLAENKQVRVDFNISEDIATTEYPYVNLKYRLLEGTTLTSGNMFAISLNGQYSDNAIQWFSIPADYTAGEWLTITDRHFTNAAFTAGEAYINIHVYSGVEIEFDDIEIHRNENYGGTTLANINFADNGTFTEVSDTAVIEEKKDYGILVDNTSATGERDHFDFFFHELGIYDYPYAPAGNYTVEFDFYALEEGYYRFIYSANIEGWKGEAARTYSSETKEIAEGEWQTVSINVAATGEICYQKISLFGGIKGYLDNFRLIGSNGVVYTDYQFTADKVGGQKVDGADSATVVEMPADIVAAKKDYAILVDNTAAKAKDDFASFHIHELKYSKHAKAPTGSYTVQFDFYALEEGNYRFIYSANDSGWSAETAKVWSAETKEIAQGEWKTITFNVNSTGEIAYQKIHFYGGIKGYLDNFKLIASDGTVYTDWKMTSKDLGASITKVSGGTYQTSTTHSIVALPDDIAAAKNPPIITGDNYDVKYIVDSEGIKTYGSNGVLHIATDAWMGYTFSEETIGANILAGKKYRLSFDYDVLTPGTNTNEWSIAMVEVRTDKEGDHNDYVTTAVPVSGSKTYEFVCTGNNNVYLAVNVGCEVVIDNIVLEEFVNYPFLGVQKRESNDEEGKVAELAYGMKLHAVDSAEYIYTMDGSAVEVEEKGFIVVLSNHIDGELTLDINDPYVKVIKVTEAAEKVIDNGNLHNVYTLAITDPEADRSITVRSYVVGTDGNVYYGDAVIAAANDLASEAFNAWIGADITE